MNEKMRMMRVNNRKKVVSNRNYGGLAKSYAGYKKDKLPQIISNLNF